ncbi:MAG: type 1 glutamine amidotransferase [Saprospiraceae bacterium]
MSKLKLAVLDLYEGTANQGMRCIREILQKYAEQIEYQEFDVRCEAELPDLDFDIYISSGGPGDPRYGDGIWDVKYYEWLQKVWDFNQQEYNERKKYVFFICHSFQMACIHFKVAQVTERKSMSYGTFPLYMTAAGEKEVLFEPLKNPFYIADFRRFQVIQPDLQVLNKMNSEILALEKPRPRIPLERAVMAIRFSKEFFGTQFHPEADADGMLIWLKDEEMKKRIVDEHGIKKYEQMIQDLSDPNKIERTQQAVLPGFLNFSIEALVAEGILVS